MNYYESYIKEIAKNHFYSIFVYKNCNPVISALLISKYISNTDRKEGLPNKGRILLMDRSELAKIEIVGNNLVLGVICSTWSRLSHIKNFISEIKLGYNILPNYGISFNKREISIFKLIIPYEDEAGAESIEDIKSILSDPLISTELDRDLDAGIVKGYSTNGNSLDVFNLSTLESYSYSRRKRFINSSVKLKVLNNLIKSIWKEK